MANYKNMMAKWRDWRLSEDKIKMGFAGFDSYFTIIERHMASLARSMKTLIKDLAQDTKDGEVYSNIKLLDDTATMPSEEDVNAKIAELEIDAQRLLEYGGWQEQLDKLYHDIDDGKLDETGEWFKAIKKVKDDNPKG